MIEKISISFTLMGNAKVSSQKENISTETSNKDIHKRQSQGEQSGNSSKGQGPKAAQEETGQRGGVVVREGVGVGMGGVKEGVGVGMGGVGVGEGVGMGMGGVGMGGVGVGEGVGMGMGGVGMGGVGVGVGMGMGGVGVGEGGVGEEREGTRGGGRIRRGSGVGTIEGTRGVEGNQIVQSSSIRYNSDRCKDSPNKNDDGCLQEFMRWFQCLSGANEKNKQQVYGGSKDMVASQYFLQSKLSQQKISDNGQTNLSIKLLTNVEQKGNNDFAALFNQALQRLTEEDYLSFQLEQKYRNLLFRVETGSYPSDYHAKNRHLLKYQMVKLYYFKQDYQKALKLLNSLIQEVQYMPSLNYSSINLKIFRFMTVYRCLETDKDKQTDIWNQYLKITKEVAAKHNLSCATQKLAFLNMLIKHALLQTQSSKGNKSQPDLSRYNNSIEKHYNKKFSDRITQIKIMQSEKGVEFKNHSKITKVNNHSFLPIDDIAQELKAQKEMKLSQLLSSQCKDTSESIFLYFQQGDRLKLVEYCHQSEKLSLLNVNCIYMALEDEYNWIKLYHSKNYIRVPKVRIERMRLKCNYIPIQSNVIHKSNHLSQDRSTDYINQKDELKQEPFDWQKKKGNKPQDISSTSRDNISRKFQKQYFKTKKGHEDYQIYSTIRRYNDGRGLQNIGNTCYINSALQCLHKSEIFNSQFSRVIEELGKKKQKSSQLLLTLQYIKLYNALWDKEQSHPYVPQAIKQIVARSNPLFQYSQQNDSIEFLSTLINVLREQLNEPKTKFSGEIDHSLHDQELIKLTKRRDRGRSNSLVEDTFTGYYKTSYTCCVQECRQNYVLFEKFNVHYLPLPPPKEEQRWFYQSREQPHPLLESLKDFEEADYMDGDNAMHCERCKRDTPTLKTMEVYEANKILILCLKRFHDGMKNERRVEVPTVIEPCSFVKDRKNPQYNAKVYQLYGAIIHSGSLRGGHYVAVCYDYYQKKWMEYNDSWVKEISLERSRLEEAYALFYELIDLKVTRDRRFLMEYNKRTGATIQ